MIKTCVKSMGSRPYRVGYEAGKEGTEIKWQMGLLWAIVFGRVLG